MHFYNDPKLSKDEPSKSSISTRQLIERKLEACREISLLTTYILKDKQEQSAGVDHYVSLHAKIWPISIKIGLPRGDSEKTGNSSSSGPGNPGNQKLVSRGPPNGCMGVHAKIWPISIKIGLSS